MTTYMIKANDLGIGRSIRHVSSRLYSVYENVVGSLRPLGSVQCIFRAGAAISGIPSDQKTARGCQGCTMWTNRLDLYRTLKRGDVDVVHVHITIAI